MDKRARIPVTLPRDGPTKPFWQDPPDAAIADLQSTPDLLPSVDIAIVGSGITGTSIAYHLMGRGRGGAPGTSIMMLEARQACSGATGRNGGHTKAASYRSFLDHAAMHGTVTAVQIARLELEGIQAVHALAAGGGDGPEPQEPIDCDSCACETVDIIYDPAQWTRAKEAVAAMRAAVGAGDPVADYTFYSREEALAAFPCSDDGATPICGAVRYAAGSVSAYRLVTGVLRRLVAGGLNLQTHTPALKVRRAVGDDGWTIETARGTVTARHVVLATNGYTAFLEPRLQGVVVPLRGQVAMYRPGRSMPHGGSLKTTYSFIYEHGYEYMITRPLGSVRAGDMVMGGGLKFAGGGAGGETEVPGLCEYGTTDDTTRNPAVEAYLYEAPTRYFGGRSGHWGEDNAAGRVRSEWTGIMGYTQDGMPLVGKMPAVAGDQVGSNGSGLWLCCAFQGHGMVFSWLCGRAAAAMVQGRDDEALRQWFPDCFRVSEARLQQQFGGRPHTAAEA